MKNVYAIAALVLFGFGCQKQDSSDTKVSGLQIPT